MELKAVVCKERGYPASLSRLYYQHKAFLHPWELVPSGGVAGGASVAEYDEHRFMIEVAYVSKEGSDVFARDYIKNEPMFRRFELGDRVDGQDYQGTWYAGVVVPQVAYGDTRVRVRGLPDRDPSPPLTVLTWATARSC